MIAHVTFDQNGKTARDLAAEKGKTAEFDAAVKKGLAMRGEFFPFLFSCCHLEQVQGSHHAQRLDTIVHGSTYVVGLPIQSSSCT